MCGATRQWLPAAAHSLIHKAPQGPHGTTLMQGMCQGGPVATGAAPLHDLCMILPKADHQHHHWQVPLCAADSICAVQRGVCMQVQEQHRLVSCSGRGFVADIWCTNNAPFGDAFTACVQLCGVAVGSDSSRLRISMEVRVRAMCACCAACVG